MTALPNNRISPSLSADPKNGIAWLQLRPSLWDERGLGWEQNSSYDDRTHTLYTPDGVAMIVDFIELPPRLQRVPFAFEVAEMLAKYGLGAPADGPVLTRNPLGDWGEPPIPEPALTVEGGLGEGRITFRYRPGVASYSYDLVGDGTCVVDYSYAGVALAFSVHRLDLPVVLGSVPLRAEVESHLMKLGLEVANFSSPTNTRPARTENYRGLPSTITYNVVGEPQVQDFNREEPPLRVMRAKDGHAMSLDVWIEDRSQVLDVGDVPCPERIRDILRHSGLKVT